MSDWLSPEELKDGSVDGFLRRAVDEGWSLRLAGRSAVTGEVLQWTVVIDGAAPADRRVLVAFACDEGMVRGALGRVEVRSSGRLAVVASGSANVAGDALRRVVEHAGGRLEECRVRLSRLEPGSTAKFWSGPEARPEAAVPPPPPPRRESRAPKVHAVDGRALVARHRALAGALSSCFGAHASAFATSQSTFAAAEAALRNEHEVAEQQVAAQLARLNQISGRGLAFFQRKARPYMWEGAINVEVEDDLDVPPAQLLEQSRDGAEMMIQRLTASMIGRRANAALAGEYLAAGRTAAERWSRENLRRLEDQLASAERAYQEARSEATDRLDAALVRIGVDLSAFERDLSTLSPSWEGADWETWDSGGAVPFAVRFGRSLYFHDDRSAALPAVLGFPGGRPLVSVVGGRRMQAIASLQSIVFRLIASFPPGKLQFMFVDPVGLGQTVAPFLHLADYDEKLVGGKVWSEPGDIEARLADITSHIELVIQKYLRSQFATIEEHNEEAGEVAEAYRFLVVADFPVNFTESAAKRLVSICQNGPRCGVYPIVLVDPTKAMPYGFDLADLKRSATVISATDQGFTWLEPGLDGAVLELESAPPLTMGKGDAVATLFKRVVENVGNASRRSAVVEVSPERIFALLDEAWRSQVKADLPMISVGLRLDDPQTWWSGSTANGLSAPIGRAGARNVQCLALGAGVAQHVLVVGKTGSGKSTLLHALVTNLALLYPPEELELYLVDLKQGVEFKCYADLTLPHARVVAINSEREFALSVLRGLDDEMRRRGELFRAVGVEDLAGHRATGGPKLPRVLLVVDEFHEIYSEEDQIAAEAANLLDRLLRQGRAFGVHAVLGSQTLAGIRGTVSRSMSQIAVRIALQCSADDSRLILAEDNPAARLLSRPGEAIYNAANGRPEANERFQVVWLPDDQRDDLLARVQRLASTRRPGRAPLIFEGTAPANPADNQALVGLLHNGSGASSRAGVSMWFGEPVAIANPVRADFARQSAANLLVLGRDAALARALVCNALVSLCAHREVEEVDVLDLTPLESGFSEFATDLSRLFPAVRVHRRRQLVPLLESVAAEVDRRLDGAGVGRRILVVHGIGQARDLDYDDYDGVGGVLHQQLSTILRDGPESGVHTVAWCDSMANLDRRLRNPLREFALRVGLAMGRDESVRLLESQAASTLKENQACLYCEDRSSQDKFRSYGPPDLVWVARELRARRG